MVVKAAIGAVGVTVALVGLARLIDCYLKAKAAYDDCVRREPNIVLSRGPLNYCEEEYFRAYWQCFLGLTPA
jgi:hypothetical protein